MKVKEKNLQKQARREKTKGRFIGLQTCRTAEQMLTEEYKPWVFICQQRQQPISLGCLCPKAMQLLIEGYFSHWHGKYVTDSVQLKSLK